jgi:glyoxylase-like metal-dependent hydrolase (beta-lactamase superfamily II)
VGFTLKQLTLGPWPMNSYILVCEETQTSAVVDPGADPQKILKAVEGTQVAAILVTHGHPDHVGALGEIKRATQAPIYLHPADADHFDLAFDIEANHNDTIQVGNQSLSVIYTPGHTPGQVCYRLGDGRILVGDTVFVNGPGKTLSADDFSTTMWTLQQIVFDWPDETEFFPGHGPSGTIGAERPAFDAFCAKGWPADLHGDVTWK